MKEYPRIVFFGTPEFAVASLRAIIEAGFNVVSVVTAPDRPSGRGLHLVQPEVKKYALETGIPVLQPENLKDPDFHLSLRNFHPDLQVVVAFRMLPEMVWQMAPLGTFNLHASLLPKYRGAAPINRAIMNGEKETGVTTFLLKQKVDTGNILFSEKTHISPDETAGELHDRLMITGADLVVKTISALVAGTVTPVPQPSGINTDAPEYRAPKIHTEDCIIDPSHDVISVYNQIRGLSPYPAANINISGNDGKDYQIRIFNAFPEVITHTETIGKVVTDGKSYFKIAVSNGFINLTRVQLAGRKAMETAEFLRGFGKKIS